MVASAAASANHSLAEAVSSGPTDLRLAGNLGDDGLPLTYTYDDLLSLDIPPAGQLIEGMIEEGSGNILGGPPNVGKSWLTLAMGRSIAGGVDFLGRFATIQGTVLVVDEESHLPGVVARAKMLDRADRLGPGLPLHFAVGRGLRLDDASAAALDRDMARVKPKLVILDSLVRVHGANENDAGQMADVFNNAKRLMRRHGAAFLFTDHVRKLGLINDPEERLRGSTEKRAWPDAIFAADPVKDDPNDLTFVQTKARHGRKLDPFTVKLEIDPVAGTARLVYGGEASTDAVTRGAEVIQAIHAVKAQLGEDAADRTAIAGWLSCSEATVTRHANQLVAAGLIASRKVKSGPRGGQPRVVYDVAGGE